MPSIRVYVRPDVAKALSREKSLMLLRTLRNEVAGRLGLETKMVEALSIDVGHSVNLPPLSVDIMYSVRPNLRPTEAFREELAKDLAKVIAGLVWLPPVVDEVAVWVLPQHEAKFAVSRRPK